MSALDISGDNNCMCLLSVLKVYNAGLLCLGAPGLCAPLSSPTKLLE